MGVADAVPPTPPISRKIFERCELVGDFKFQAKFSIGSGRRNLSNGKRLAQERHTAGQIAEQDERWLKGGMGMAKGEDKGEAGPGLRRGA